MCIYLCSYANYLELLSEKLDNVPKVEILYIVHKLSDDIVLCMCFITTEM